MKRILDCILKLGVVLGFWIFAINPAYRFYCRYRALEDQAFEHAWSAEMARRDKEKEATLVQREPKLLPAQTIDHPIRSIDEWVVEERQPVDRTPVLVLLDKTTLR